MLRPIERPALQKEGPNGNGSFGNAATRIEALMIGGDTYVYCGDADIDGLFQEQGAELDRRKREACLHRIQQLIFDKSRLRRRAECPR